MATLTQASLFLQVANLVTKYGIKNLVETGTGPNSSGMETAKRLGLHGYTCDVLEQNAVKAATQFADFDVYYGDSVSALKDCLPKLVGPTFFWLDAHCPDDPSSLPGAIFPLYDELVLIQELKKDYERDIIWMDDVSMIADPENPLAKEWDREFRGEKWIGEKGHLWVDYLSLFAGTHNYGLIFEDGILMLIPK